LNLLKINKKELKGMSWTKESSMAYDEGNKGIKNKPCMRSWELKDSNVANN
jgi:hypothetical protein